MSITPQTLHYHLSRLAGDAENFLIAYSGGVDSHVLLHLCAQLKNLPSGCSHLFSAVYIDHGLSPNAKKWGQHCQHICFELDIPLTIIEVNGRAENGQSPEAAARTARYQAFAQILKEGEYLLTAQHLDDQAETLLLQLLRGSGTRGLSAMPTIKPFAQGWLCRPMLDDKKQAILAYARQHQLQWVEDESNQEQQFDRNFLRHTILPELEQRWPAAQRNLAKSAQVLGESQYLLDKMAEADLRQVLEDDHKSPVYTKIALQETRALLEIDEQQTQFKLSRLHNLLRYWIHINHLPLPSRKILEQIVQNVIFSRADASPLVRWKRDHFQCELRKYRESVYLINTTAQILPDRDTLDREYLLLPNQLLHIPGIGNIEVQSAAGSESQDLMVRFRRGGERFRKYPQASSTLLKHWFQEQAIPPWERDYIPLIYQADELIQVGNTIVSHRLLTKDKNNSVIICWKRD